MLSNIIKNGLLLHGKSALLKRCNVRQISHNSKNRWDEVASRNQSTTLESEDDFDKPIKYSTSKAATMRIEEYRDPYGDSRPWYQGYVVSASLAVFLIYFCILREENDIDNLIYCDLNETLSKVKREEEEKLKFK
ncbi:PREDICTED: protein CCSMST1 [Acromyrmex echinatior]|uniref:protein CCSMST1 n=1 Tax=Acromyrmex echinatior TaxID=103372 RepID=UPI000580FC40|nr:PREDICTED: protein CCSMST1 [Acromyrmex echinatior]